MESEFRPGAISYETIQHERELPFRCFFNSLRFIGNHWHAELELLLQTEGSIVISMLDKVTELSPGDLFLANPFQVHSLYAQTEHNQTLALQIDVTDPLLLPRQLGGHRFIPANEWTQDLKENVHQEIVTIAREIAERKDGHAHACLGALARIISLLVRNAAAPRGSAGESSAPPIDGRPAWFEHVTTIIRYLQERFAYPISLDQLAEHVGLSRYYVSHLVKAATGLSLQENLGLIRTNRAIHLMFTTDAKLVDIAMDAGFSHLKYFNKYFRRLYGATPSHVRSRADWREAVLTGSPGNPRRPSKELVARLEERR